MHRGRAGRRRASRCSRRPACFLLTARSPSHVKVDKAWALALQQHLAADQLQRHIGGQVVGRAVEIAGLHRDNVAHAAIRQRLSQLPAAVHLPLRQVGQVQISASVQAGPGRVLARTAAAGAKAAEARRSQQHWGPSNLLRCALLAKGRKQGQQHYSSDRHWHSRPQERQRRLLFTIADGLDQEVFMAARRFHLKGAEGARTRGVRIRTA